MQLLQSHKKVAYIRRLHIRVGKSRLLVLQKIGSQGKAAYTVEYSRIGIYAIRLYATIAYMQLFFLAPKVTFALKTRQLYATDGYMLLFCGSRAVAYIPILLYKRVAYIRILLYII